MNDIGVTDRSDKNSPARSSWLLAMLGLVAMYLPTILDLSGDLWRREDHLQGPVVLAVSLWLLYQKFPLLVTRKPNEGRPFIAWPVLICGCLFYVLGRSQGILLLEVGSIIWMLAGTVLLIGGVPALKAVWFPLFFMAFMVPLPGFVVDALTQPMKIAVSVVVESLLYHLGYPVARAGVILQVGQYQLLVANACAGLHTLFTLEALGLLYLNLVRHASLLRNAALALLIVPISFSANVIRVMALALITYHFGDEAGQGFLHEFAGMVLFFSALALIVGTDSMARALSRVPVGAAEKTASRDVV